LKARTSQTRCEEAAVRGEDFTALRKLALGECLASLVISSLPEAVVRGLLPEGLELLPQALAPRGEHPVLLYFLEHRDVRPVPPLFRVAYREFVLAIPSVRWKGAPADYAGPFVYWPRLYLDRTLPILAGHLYGYAKQRALIDASETGWSVRATKDGTELVSAAFQPRGTLDACGAGTTYDTFVSDVSTQPLIARSPLGFFVVSFLDGALARDEVQVLDAEVRIAHAFLPGLPLTTHRGDVGRSGLGGAFRTKLRWSLSWPMRSVPDQARARGRAVAAAMPLHSRADR